MDIQLGIPDYISIISIVVGIIGIIVGIIGLLNMSYAKKIVNKSNLKNSNNNTINQAEIILNGLDPYAVVKLSRETTKEELCEIINKIECMQKELNKKPNIIISENEPAEAKNGDLWFKI